MQGKRGRLPPLINIRKDSLFSQPRSRGGCGGRGNRSFHIPDPTPVQPGLWPARMHTSIPGGPGTGSPTRGSGKRRPRREGLWAGPRPRTEASRVSARGRGRRAAAFSQGREGPARPGRPAGRGAAAPGRAGPQTMGAAAGGARRREQPGGGARERAPPAPAPRPLPCRSPPRSAAGSGAIPGPRFRAPGPRHGSLSAPIPRPLPPGPRGGQAAVWDAEGVAGSRAPSAPPSPALPVRERGVRRDPERCGYKGAGPSPPALRGGGECRAAGVRAKFARKRKEGEKRERRTIVRGAGMACGGRGPQGTPPFRSVFPLQGGVPPQLCGGPGARGEGAEPGPGEPGTFLGPGPRRGP